MTFSNFWSMPVKIQFSWTYPLNQHTCQYPECRTWRYYITDFGHKHVTHVKDLLPGFKPNQPIFWALPHPFLSCQTGTEEELGSGRAVQDMHSSSQPAASRAAAPPGPLTVGTSEQPGWIYGEHRGQAAKGTENYWAPLRLDCTESRGVDPQTCGNSLSLGFPVPISFTKTKPSFSQVLSILPSTDTFWICSNVNKANFYFTLC